MAKRKAQDLQTNFTAGLLDQLMFGRVDTRLYKNGASILENWLQLAQGGIRRRPGTRFLLEFSSGQPEASFPRLRPFVFSETQSYLLAFTPSTLDIYDPVTGGLVQSIAGTPWTTNALIDNLHFSQRGDTMVIVHNDFPMRRLLRTGALTFTLDLFLFEDNGVASLEPFFKFADPAVTLTLGATSGATTATASAAHFSANHVGSRLRTIDTAGNSVEMGITSFVSPTVVNVNLRATTTTTGPFQNWVEAVFSAHNGYAKAVTFHGQRLWFSGGVGLPSHIFGSKSGAFFNFAVGTGEPDESPQAPLAADQVNNIHHLVSGERLFILTDQGIFFVSETDDAPITPASLNTKRISSNGSTNSVRPLIYDDEILYVERGAVGVRKLFNDEFTTRIRNESITLVMSNSIEGTFTQVATMDALEDRPENYAFFVTSTGDMFVYHSISTENLQGWSKWTTNGAFKSAAGIVDKLYISAFRTVNGIAKHWIEVLDEDVTVDGAIVSVLGTPPPNPAPAFLGFNVWLGQEIDIVIDGPDGTMNNYYLGTTIPIEGVGEPVPVIVVLPGNTVGLSESESILASRCVGGYGFPATVKLMPVTIEANDGEQLTEPKRIVSVSPIVDGAYGVNLGTNRLEIKRTNSDFSADAVPFTGIHKFYHFGWSRRGDIQLDVLQPLDITILGVNREVVF